MPWENQAGASRGYKQPSRWRERLSTRCAPGPGVRPRVRTQPGLMGLAFRRERDSKRNRRTKVSSDRDPRKRMKLGGVTEGPGRRATWPGWSFRKSLSPVSCHCRAGLSVQ